MEDEEIGKGTVVDKDKWVNVVDTWMCKDIVGDWTEQKLDGIMNKVVATLNEKFKCENN